MADYIQRTEIKSVEVKQQSDITIKKLKDNFLDSFQENYKDFVKHNSNFDNSIVTIVDKKIKTHSICYIFI